ncbi:MAG: signal peptidase [Nocardioides sp.]|nr:signal peptidase [Nocardioides sp.]
MTGRLREALLWAGAAVGLVSIVAGIAVTFFGFSFLVFRSGSMSPDISTGSLALARTTEASDLRPGDVVSVVGANGERITHRLVSSTVRGDTASLVLKGDANGAPDQEIYVVTEAERSVVSVPYAGYVVTLLLSPAGLVAAACLSAMLLLIGFGSRADEDSKLPLTLPGGRHRAAKRRGFGVLLGTAVGVSVVAAMTASAGIAGTFASFSDQASATTGAFSMAAVPSTPVTNVRCVPSGLNSNAFIRWDAPAGSTPTGYRLNYTSNQASGFVGYGPGITEGRPPVPGASGNRTYTVTVTAVYGNQLSQVSTTSASILGRNSALLPWSCA